jgi:hypothetical protein
MSQSTVHSHSYQHFEDLQLSAKDFYAMLETFITDYQYPGVVCQCLVLREGGLFSSRREYLCIAKDRYRYYVCASPFGRSFFISWWLKEKEDSYTLFLSRIPFIGKWLVSDIQKKTFYEVDTETMFVQSITSIIKRTVNIVMAEHGFHTPELAAETV